MVSAIQLNHWYQPEPEQVQESFQAFFASLSGATVIHVNGEDATRTRVIVTLLHGNEPSGLKAIHQLLKQEMTPKTNVKFIIASVVAAKTEPVFTHRMLPGKRDLNRCFIPPYDDLQGQLAKSIQELITEYQPEAVLDIHNTSGSGPAFSVAITECEKTLALASYFTHRIIVTDIRLGSLMEVDFGCPVVTIECGGVQDREADVTALDGMMKFLHQDSLFEIQQDMALLKHPRRLQIRPESSIGYGERLNPELDITICQDVERHNFGVTQPGDVLGYLSLDGLRHFCLDSSETGKSVEDYFAIQNGQLKCKQPLRLFMVTTRADIAKSDCLFYFVTG